MRFLPFFIAFRLFASAGNGATIIDNAGNVWLTNFGAVIPSADAFQKTGVDTLPGAFPPAAGDRYAAARRVPPRRMP
jgi:hypothetical protein